MHAELLTSQTHQQVWHPYCVLDTHFPWSRESSEVPEVDDRICSSEGNWEANHVRLQCAVWHQKIQADGRCRPAPTFQPWQMVWLFTRELALKVPSRKLSPRNAESFKVVRHINPVSYGLHLPPNYHILPSFHDSPLIPVSSITPSSLLTPPALDVTRSLANLTSKAVRCNLVDYRDYDSEEWLCSLNEDWNHI